MLQVLVAATTVLMHSYEVRANAPALARLKHGLARSAS
jgi:hypothetical protein